MVLTATHQLLDSRVSRDSDLACYMSVSIHTTMGRLRETHLPEAAYIAFDIAWDSLILP